MDATNIAFEKLQLKYEHANQALKKLSNGIDDFKTIKQLITSNNAPALLAEHYNDRMANTYRNSAIKLFELAFDCNWKYIKEFLWTIHGIDLASPKNVYRSCVDLSLLSQASGTLALDMVDDRNKATHTYDEAMADKIYQKIAAYLAIMQKLLKQTKPSQQ